MRRLLPRPGAAPLVAAVLVLSGCAAVGTASTSDPVAAGQAADPGAAARLALLSRYDGVTAVRTLVTPSILGRTPAAATALLEEAGLDIHVVAFDRQRPVTVQWPRAGQPVPLDGVIEAWLGRPPVEDVPTQTAAPLPPATATGTPTAAATTVAAATSAPAPTTTQSGGVTHVLPPHTDGLLRVNPRRLPALPLGTQLLGRASWYGPGFHGLTTACGGVFDRNGATLASRELRCGTVVRITGPSGLTVEATVTDWGPAEWTGRRFDLSEAVFDAIAPLGAGVIDVSVITANVPG